MRRLLVATVTLTLLTACQPGLMTAPPSGPRAPTAAGTPYRADQAVLTGRVTAPGFATQATSAQVVDSALVTLVDANGVTQAGGVTTAAGLFTLFPVANGFTPVNGSFYTLNVSRRLASGSVLSLRTTVKLVGTGWTSITGTTVVVNLTTTAIAGIDAEDAAVTPELTMATVSGATFEDVAAIGAWTADRITGRIAGLTAQLTADFDPAGSPAVTYTGNYTITTAQSLANFRHYTAITGNLTVGGTLTSIELPNLRTVGGSLNVNNHAALTSLSLPSLQTVTSLLTIQGGHSALTSVSLPGLTTVGSLLIEQSTALTSVSLPGLTTTSGVQIISNSALTSVSLPGLPTISGNLNVNNNNALTSLVLPVLTSVTGSLTITSNTLLSLSFQIMPVINQLQPPPAVTVTTGNAV